MMSDACTLSAARTAEEAMDSSLDMTGLLLRWPSLGVLPNCTAGYMAPLELWPAPQGEKYLANLTESIYREQIEKESPNKKTFNCKLSPNRSSGSNNKGRLSTR